MASIDAFWIVLACFGSYLLGSIPFSVWLGKLATGEDLRNHNTQNPGGFNALRTYGPTIGISVIFLDQLKGIATLAFIDHLFSLEHFQRSDGSNIIHTVMCVTGPFLCIIGHNYSIWLKFKGGQGMGVFMGTLIYLNPLLLIFYMAVYAILYAGLKIPTRTTGTITVPICIIAALFIPIGPPWNNLLLDWTIGENAFLFITQGLVVIAMTLAFFTKRIEGLFGKNKVGVEKVFEKE